MWATLAAVGMLIVLSVVGAFIGTQRARALFNSIPLAVFWSLLVALLLVGLAAFRTLLRSPGLLALHLACLLILGGAMYGSNDGHAVAAKLLGTRKIPFGYMIIFEGYADNIVRDANGNELGTLPFSIGLRDFWIEYYEEAGPWLLGIDAPPAGDGHNRRRRVIPWAVGEENDVPFTDVRVKVLQYIPRARPVCDKDAKPILEITTPDGQKTRVPVQVGKKMPLPSQDGTLRVVRVFSHLLVKDGKATDMPGSQASPALKIELETPDGQKSYRYAFAGRISMHGDGRDGMQLRYCLPEVVAARPDPDSRLPAMELLVTRKDKKLRKWLVGKEPDRPVELSLEPLLGAVVYTDAHGHKHAGPRLVMTARRGAIRDFKSKLVVLEEGRIVTEKDIEVNDPLHYAGYHFYQHSYDDRAGRFTVLSVRSDSGLLAVYVGFVLLCSGAVWRLWVRPVWRHFRRPQQ